MNRTPRLSKSGIEYLDYVWNFYSGCHNWENGICSVGKDCWAKKITQRFPSHYPNGFEPTFYPEAFLSPLHLKKPSVIGCAFMGDLFGDWVNYTDENGTVTPKNIVYPIIERCPQHTFLFLTKCPWNLAKWSPFPDNCWVGVSATNKGMVINAVNHLLNHRIAKTQFISIEPLLEWNLRDKSYPLASSISKKDLDWVIIGAQTKPTVYPKIEWVQEIVEAADKAGVKVFLKDNLRPLLVDSLAKKLIDRQQFFVANDEGYGWKLRQEMPKER